MATLKELKSQHRNIIQMSFNGYTNNEIAERLGMAPSTISIILRSPLGQAYMNGLQDRAQEATLDVRKKLVSLNTEALKTIERLLNPREKAPHSVQFSAAKDVLDRTGYKAPDRLNIDMTLQTKTDEELDAEISAMEASINRANKRTNLPKVESHHVCENETFSPSNTLAYPDDSNPEAPDDDLSLEDSLNSEEYYFPFESDSSEDDFTKPVSFADIEAINAKHFEDLDLLNNLSFDPFHNINKG